MLFVDYVRDGDQPHPPRWVDRAVRGIGKAMIWSGISVIIIFWVIVALLFALVRI